MNTKCDCCLAPINDGEDCFFIEGGATLCCACYNVYCGLSFSDGEEYEDASICGEIAV